MLIRLPLWILPGGTVYLFGVRRAGARATPYRRCGIPTGGLGGLGLVCQPLQLRVQSWVLSNRGLHVQSRWQSPDRNINKQCSFVSRKLARGTRTFHVGSRPLPGEQWMRGGEARLEESAWQSPSGSKEGTGNEIDPPSSQAKPERQGNCKWRAKGGVRGGRN